MKQDKSLPQALDLEEVVIGAVLLESDAIIQVIDFLRPEMFYNNKFGEIYRCCVRMFEKGESIDILTVTNKLKATPFHGGGTTLEYVGGAYSIISLTNRVASSANITNHTKIIAQKYIERELLNISAVLQTKVYEGRTDTFMLESYVSDMQGLFTGVLSNKSEKMMPTLTDEAVQAYMARKGNARDGIVPGVPSGIANFDKHTGGFQDTDLIIIAARPAMGKTALMIQAAKHAAEIKKPVGVFSLEMSSRQLVDRILITESHADGKGYKSGNLLDHHEQAVIEAAQKLSHIPLLIDDTPGITITQMRAKAKRWKVQHGICALYVDYLQLITASVKTGNRDAQIGEITRTLKIIAKELEIPVIALSQLSRNVEGRGGDKRPGLTDLRESGNIEQDADMVIFIHRPEYYGFMTDENGGSTKDKAELIIAKFRSGSVGTVHVGFIDYLTKFFDPNNAVASAATLAGITPNEDFLTNKEPF